MATISLDCNDCATQCPLNTISSTATALSAEKTPLDLFNAALFRFICSPSNQQTKADGTRYGAEFPCDMNAGSIASLGITLGSILFISGLILYVVAMSWPKGDENMAWGMRMNKLGLMVNHSIKAFFFKLVVAVGVWTFIWFLLLLIVFSSLEYYDATDGIRYASALLTSVLVSIVCVFVVITSAGESITRTARQAVNTYTGMGASLRTGFSISVAAVFFTLNLLLLAFTCFYLFYTLDRKKNNLTVYNVPCNSNNPYGAFCGQVTGMHTMVAFGLGVSCLTMILRGTSGVFAKAAEIGSELIHKLEADTATADKIRNPATLMDKTGAIVMDAGGIIMDTAETMVLLIIAAGVMAIGDSPKIAIAMWLPGADMAACLIGFVCIRAFGTSEEVADRHNAALWAFRLGVYVASFLVVVFSAVVIGILYTDMDSYFGSQDFGWKAFACHLLGMVTSIFLWESASFFTSHRWFPTRSVTAAGITGPATLVVQGLGVAFISAFPFMFIAGFAVVLFNAIAGNYGVAIGGMGMFSLAPLFAAANAFSPAAYGADDSLDAPDVQAARQVSVPLVMAGESYTAEYRAWSIPMAMTTAAAVLMAFRQESGIGSEFLGGIYRDSDHILEGLLFGFAMGGAFFVLLLAGINSLAIGKATRALVDETRRQFSAMAGQGNECDPTSMIKETFYPSIMGAMLPAGYTILVPAIVGYLAGPRALAAFCSGAVLAGGPIALICCNSGASWAKSKTAIEAELIFGGTGSEAHIASVVGARAGGALKDVAGPTIISAMKNLSIVSLMLAPTIFVHAPRTDILGCILENANDSGDNINNCFDWDKPYWFLLPAFLFMIMTLFIYFVYWNQDGGGEGEPMEVPVEPIIPVQPVPMTVAAAPQPIGITTIQSPIQTLQQPIGITTMPQPTMMNMPITTELVHAAPPPVQYTVAGPPEPYMAAPMRPEMASVDNFVASGYSVTQM